MVFFHFIRPFHLNIASLNLIVLIKIDFFRRIWLDFPVNSSFSLLLRGCVGVCFCFGVSSVKIAWPPTGPCLYLFNFSNKISSFQNLSLSFSFRLSYSFVLEIFLLLLPSIFPLDSLGTWLWRGVLPSRCHAYPERICREMDGERRRVTILGLSERRFWLVCGRSMRCIIGGIVVDEWWWRRVSDGWMLVIMIHFWVVNELKMNKRIVLFHISFSSKEKRENSGVWQWWQQGGFAWQHC